MGCCIVIKAERGAIGSAVVMACKISGNEIAAFYPAAGTGALRIVMVSAVIVVLVHKNPETEHVLDSTVEIEQSGADWDEYEHWKEIVEAGPKRSEVDEAAEKGIKGSRFMDVLWEEGEKVIRQGDGQFGNLTGVPACGFGVSVPPDEAAVVPYGDIFYADECTSAHVGNPASGNDLTTKTDLIVFGGRVMDDC